MWLAVPWQREPLRQHAPDLGPVVVDDAEAHRVALAAIGRDAFVADNASISIFQFARSIFRKRMQPATSPDLCGTVRNGIAQVA